MQKLELDPPHKLGTFYVCLPNAESGHACWPQGRWSQVQFWADVSIHIPFSAFALLRYFMFVALLVYIMSAVSLRYVDGNGSSFFFAATLQMCRNSFFRPSEILVRGAFVYKAF
jgi:hypothetical protein